MENKTQIILDNGLELDLITDIGFALTYQVDDIRNPNTSNASFSKNIQLPGTTNNNTILGGLYDINASFEIFNPNIKTFASIIVNDTVVMKGYFQLKPIDKEQQTDQQGNNITYNIVFFENSVDIFSLIKDQFIRGNSDSSKDIDFSDLDQVLSLSVVRDSWNHANFISNGFVYPITFPPNSDFAYTLSHMTPAIGHKQYLERIFTKEGYTLGGSFIDDTNQRYAREVIPYNGSNPLTDEVELATREFRASYLGASSYATFDLGQNSTDVLDRYEFLDVKFVDDTTPPNFDNDNNWNTSTQTYTVKKNGLYDLAFNVSGSIATYAREEVECYYIAPGAITLYQDLYWRTVDIVPTQVKVVLQAYVNGTSYGPQLSSGYFDLYPINDLDAASPNNGYSSNNNFRTSANWAFNGQVVSNAVLRAGDEVTFLIKFKVSETYKTPRFMSTAPVSGSYVNTERDIEYTFSVNSASNISNNAVEGLVFAGDTMYFNDFIPDKMKKQDILNDILKRYNLFLSVDPTNSKNILLESRDDYYDKPEQLDWTLKKDYSKKDKIEILSDLQNKELLFTYTPDSDDANKNYTESTKDVYGQKTISYTNEFVSGTKKIQTPFSPTPLVKEEGPNGSFIVSYIETPEPKNKMRVLIYALESMLSGTWTLSDGTSVGKYTFYPYIGHFNNPINPSFDINFGLNSFYYYDDYNALPTDNLYNTYWANYVDYVSDGRLVTSYFALNESDIFTVKDALYTKIFVKDSWYWINKIIDFNPMGDGLTKVELLKIKNL